MNTIGVMRPLNEPAAGELRITAVMHALSDPTRLQITRLLADQERHCSEFETQLSKPSLSHHFRVLRDAGITHTRRSGRFNYLSLRRADLDQRFPGLLDAVLDNIGDELANDTGEMLTLKPAQRSG